MTSDCIFWSGHQWMDMLERSTWWSLWNSLMRTFVWTHNWPCSPSMCSYSCWEEAWGSWRAWGVLCLILLTVGYQVLLGTVLRTTGVFPLVPTLLEMIYLSNLICFIFQLDFPIKNIFPQIWFSWCCVSIGLEHSGMFHVFLIAKSKS